MDHIVQNNVRNSFIFLDFLILYCRVKSVVMNKPVVNPFECPGKYKKMSLNSPSCNVVFSYYANYLDFLSFPQNSLSSQ